MRMKRLLSRCCALLVAVAFSGPAVAAEPVHKQTKAPVRKPATKLAQPFVPGGSAVSAAVSGGTPTSSRTESSDGTKNGVAPVGKKVESKDEPDPKK
jgi:hypothetical protein